jgi:hypothetical protein
MVVKFVVTRLRAKIAQSCFVQFVKQHFTNCIFAQYMSSYVTRKLPNSSVHKRSQLSFPHSFSLHFCHIIALLNFLGTSTLGSFFFFFLLLSFCDFGFHSCPILRETLRS